MEKHQYPGKFIVIEGLDGSGSSTQVDLLVKYLNQNGKKAYSTKEPTNNLVGGLLRGLLTKEWTISPEGFQLLFAADRAHHLKREIIPLLEKGNIVVSDRYAFSTIAFGGIDLDKQWLEGLNRYFILPDLTILLKVRPEICMQRIGRARSESEFFEEETKLKKVWSNYYTLSKNTKNRITVINGEQDVAQVSENIRKVIMELL